MKGTNDGPGTDAPSISPTVSDAARPQIRGVCVCVGSMVRGWGLRGWGDRGSLGGWGGGGLHGVGWGEGGGKGEARAKVRIAR